MNEIEFGEMQKKFAQRLFWLLQIPAQYKSRNFDVDKIAEVIDKTVKGTEDIKRLLVLQFPANDRRLRERMVAINHPLADCPSPILWGDTFSSDEVRVKRYELLSVLMVKSGFPKDLLDDGVRFERWRFRPMSEFFKRIDIKQLNEQFISCWGRRTLSYYGTIEDVKVPDRELRDNFARGNAGETTENLLRQELGMAKPSMSPDLSHLFANL